MPTESKVKAPHLLRGENAEEQAFQFLLAQGLALISRNFRCTLGEIDLIMEDKQSLVFVEVRFRKSNKFGSALESITKSKQNRIISATQIFLSTKKEDRPIRFDVIAISGDEKIEWIKNAF